jgi:hypothetical protein
MGRDDDRPDYLDRDKKSFSELDRLRREGRGAGDRRPRGEAARAQEKRATSQYLKQIDGLFRGGAKGDALAAAMLDARGTPGLADACRAYRDAVGAPPTARLIACFLDCGAPELVSLGLEALAASEAAGTLEVTRGLRTQLRMLTQDSDDDVAEAAEELLERL